MLTSTLLMYSVSHISYSCWYSVV